jgi:transcriptional regulator with XRE-family HTH domain
VKPNPETPKPGRSKLSQEKTMKLTPFGQAVRLLRMRLGLSLKSMADAMEISSSYLSGIEYGEKRLAQKHIDSAITFFKDQIISQERATQEEIHEVLKAAEKSKGIVNTESLNADAKGLVAAFARRLEEGDAPTPEIVDWINKRCSGKK